MTLTRTYTEVDKEMQRCEGVGKLVVGTRLPFDVYVGTGAGRRHLFDRGMVFTQFARDVLKEKGIEEFSVDRPDFPDLESYLSQGGRQQKLSESDPALFSEYAFEKERYYQIDRNALIQGTEVPFTIYLLHGFSFIILAEASEERPRTVDKTALSASGDLLIRTTDVPRYNDYLKACIAQAGPATGQAGARIKAAVLRENSKVVIKDLLEDPRSGAKIKESTLLVQSMIDSVLQNRDAVYDLLSIRNYDYYTYTHSVNVAVMSIGLAASIGMEREEMEKLGIGALLHDIGKSAVPSDILNKQGKLNFTEYQIIKGHVTEGEKIVKEHRDIPAEALPAVTQHHEKLTGKGYPAGLTRNSIKLFGRITAVADCYDALTTRRPYKTAFTPFYALALLVREKEDYDCSLMKEFIAMLGRVV
jgi:putative nucleotidyltransferase with HDIG domain